VRGVAAACHDARMGRPRVFLRKPTRRDRDELLALQHGSGAFLRPWSATSPDGARPDPVRAFEALLEANRGDRSLRLLVCRASDGAILGAMNVNEIVRGSFRSAYLGYWIGAPHARRGYMTEALALVLRTAFEDLGLHRVEANVVPANRPSIALVRRAGFRREGLSRRYLHIAGRWRDHERWALLAEDWRQRTRKAKRAGGLKAKPSKTRTSNS
jgi:ribosomal-protein-alanine N-acetyltransferase